MVVKRRGLWNRIVEGKGLALDEVGSNVIDVWVGRLAAHLYSAAHFAVAVEVTVSIRILCFCLDRQGRPGGFVLRSSSPGGHRGQE